MCEGRRKSLRRPSGFDPEFLCCFSWSPLRALILSSLGSADAEAVVFIFFPGLIERAEINVDLIAVAVLCRCVYHWALSVVRMYVMRAFLHSRVRVERYYYV